MQIVLEWMQPRCSCVCFRMLLSALFLFLHLHVNRKYKHLLLPGIGYQQDKVAKQVASCTYITAPAVQPGEEASNGQRWAAAYAPEVCCRSHSAKELFGNFPPRTRGQLWGRLITTHFAARHIRQCECSGAKIQILYTLAFENRAVDAPVPLLLGAQVHASGLGV